MRSVTAALVLSCLLALSVMAGTAHAQVRGGSMIGAIEDTSGGVLPGVVLTISSPALDAGEQVTVTDGTGGYRFINLPPGAYTLTVTLDGFATYVEEELRVTVGGTIERNVSMELATVAEMITVTGESPVVDPRRVGVKDNLELEALETIPVHNYYATEYAKWTGGVSAREPSGDSNQVSIMGSNPSENTVMYDGVFINNISSGGQWGSGDLAAMEEIEIVTMGASAEYQVAQGGVFNVVFKTGTNQWRGDAQAFFYPDQLLSKPITRPCSCPLGETGYVNRAYHNYSGHGGGPLVRDRMFFWAGGNLDRRKQYNPGTNPDPPLGREIWYSDAVSAKTTYNITDNVRASGGWSIDYWGGQGVPTIERPLDTRVAGFGKSNAYKTELTSTFGSNTLLTVRVSGWIDNYPTKAMTGAFPPSSPQRIDEDTDVRSQGTDPIRQNFLDRHNPTVKINHFIQGETVAHDLRGGLQFEFGGEERFATAPGGLIFHDFAGMPDELKVVPLDARGANASSFGLWVEDALTFDRLTLNVGVRYDHMEAISQDIPEFDTALAKTGATINGLGTLYEWDVVAPRFGFNYKLNESGTAVLRGTVGRAHRNIRTGEYDDGHPGRGGVTTRAWDGVTPLSAATSIAAYPTIIGVTDPTANLPIIDPNTETPYTDSLSIGTDVEVAPQVGVGWSYVYKYGQKFIGEEDRGSTFVEGVAVLPNGLTVPTFSRTSAAAAEQVFLGNGPGTFQRYHGLILNLDKRMRDNWSANVSYTFSKSEGLLSTEADPNERTNRGGRINLYDRPQMVTVLAMYQFPWDVLLVGSYIGASGDPFARETSITLPQGRRDIAIEPADGTFRMDRQDILNFRLSKSFRRGAKNIELGAEFQNMLQDEAWQSVSSTNFFSTSFNEPDFWIEPRRVNFFIRSKF